jgi:hypothetical protein
MIHSIRIRKVPRDHPRSIQRHRHSSLEIPTPRPGHIKGTNFTLWTSHESMIRAIRVNIVADDQALVVIFFRDRSLERSCSRSAMCLGKVLFRLPVHRMS